MKHSENTLVNARRLMYLVSQEADEDLQRMWTEEARAGGFPYVEIQVRQVGGGVRLVYETLHLPAEIAGKARMLMQEQKARRPHAHVVAAGPTCEAIGPIPMKDARALAKRIVDLTKTSMASGSDRMVPVA